MPNDTKQEPAKEQSKREQLEESLNDFRKNTGFLSHRDRILVLTGEAVLELTKPQPELIPPA